MSAPHICRHCALPEVASDDEKWADWPVTKTARSCMLFQLWLVDKHAGHRVLIPRPCHSWSERRCAIRRAAEIVHQLHCRFEESGEVWYGYTAYSERLPARMRRRRMQKEANLAWIRRVDDGTVHYFADSELGGIRAPTNGWVTQPSPATIILARRSLALPGVGRMGFSDGWRPSGRRSSGNLLYVGLATNQARQEAEDLAFQWIGVSRPLLDNSAPSKLPAEQWAELLRMALDVVLQRQAEANSRRAHEISFTPQPESHENPLLDPYRSNRDHAPEDKP